MLHYVIIFKNNTTLPTVIEKKRKMDTILLNSFLFKLTYYPKKPGPQLDTLLPEDIDTWLPPNTEPLFKRLFRYENREPNSAGSATEELVFQAHYQKRRISTQTHYSTLPNILLQQTTSLRLFSQISCLKGQDVLGEDKTQGRVDCDKAQSSQLRICQVHLNLKDDKT